MLVQKKIADWKRDILKYALKREKMSCAKHGCDCNGGDGDICRNGDHDDGNTIIEFADKTVGERFLRSVKKLGLGVGGVTLYMCDCVGFVSSPWFTTKMESNWDSGAADNGRRTQKLLQIFVFAK